MRDVLARGVSVDLLGAACVLAACSGGPSAPTDGTGGAEAEAEEAAAWAEVKVAVHVHSVNSHDACDNNPRPGGRPDPVCAQDLRDGVCRTRFDHVFLTDHDGHMAEVAWDDLLAPYWREGDAWIGGTARTGLLMRCGPEHGGHEAALFPGGENDLMPVGLDRHVGDHLAVGSAELHRLYDAWGEEQVAAFRQAGGVTFVNHAEARTTDEIAGLSVDGIEIYNIHAMLKALLAGAASIGDISEFLRTDGGAPPPDLLFLALYPDNVEDLTHWSRLSPGRRLAGVAAHDVHRNALPGAMDDGERLDSYRRVLSWFSNRALVPRAVRAAGADPEAARVAVREALKEGRLYVTGDLVGDPAGFSAVVRGPAAADGAAASEVVIGGEAPWADGMAVHVTPPAVVPEGAEVSARLVEMRADGSWSTLEQGPGGADAPMTPPGPGVYRVEVVMIPRHLSAALRGAAWLADRPFTWIRTNPFHLR